MEFILTIILFHLIMSQTFSQRGTSCYNFMYATIRTYQRTGTIYYGDNPYNGISKEYFHPLFTNPVVNVFGSNNKSSITLTKKEKKYILSRLLNSSQELLPDSLFPNSKRKVSDSLQKFIRKLNKSVHDSLIILHDTLEAYKFLTSSSKYSSFFISKPIFIRKHSIFLNYFAWFPGGSWGGSDELCFYRKQNNKWTKWITVKSGDY